MRTLESYFVIVTRWQHNITIHKERHQAVPQVHIMTETLSKVACKVDSNHYQPVSK